MQAGDRLTGDRLAGRQKGQALMNLWKQMVKI
jgi:hypothetical protein